VQENETRRRHL